MNQKIIQYLKSENTHTTTKNVINHFKTAETKPQTIKKYIFDLLKEGKEIISLDSEDKIIMHKDHLKNYSVEEYKQNNKDGLSPKNTSLISEINDCSPYAPINEEEIKCDSKQYTWSPGEIKTMITEDGFLKLPKYQRGYKWTQKQASAFIESLIFGLPVPNIFVYKNNDRQYEIVDGQQRIKTIECFMSEKPLPGHTKTFALKGVIDRLKNKTWSELKDTDKFTIKQSRINVIEFLVENSGRKMLLQLFKRLNSAGEPLTDDEIRVAVYQSEIFNKIISIANLREWRFYFSEKEIKDQKHIGVLLRSITVYAYYIYYSHLKTTDLDIIKFSNLGKELDGFANYLISFTQEHEVKSTELRWYPSAFNSANITKDNIDERIIDNFKWAISFIYSNFAEQAFIGLKRKENPQDDDELGGKRKDTIAEALIIATLINKSIIQKSEINIDKVNEQRNSLVMSSKFIDTLSSSTSNTNIITRIQLMKSIYDNYNK